MKIHNDNVNLHHQNIWQKVIYRYVSVGRGERGGIVFLLQKRIYYKVYRDKTERQITATCEI